MVALAGGGEDIETSTACQEAPLAVLDGVLNAL